MRSTDKAKEREGGGGSEGTVGELGYFFMSQLAFMPCKEHIKDDQAQLWMSKV